MKKIAQISRKVELLGIGRYLSQAFALIKINYKIRNKVIKVLKILINFRLFLLNFIERKSYKNRITISKELHSLHFPKGTLLGTEQLIIHIRKYFIKKKEFIKKNYTSPYYPLITPPKNKILTREEEDLIKPIFSFASQKKIIDIVSEHLNIKPIIAGVTLNYSQPIQPNTKEQSSQLFHRDLNDETLIHFIMPVYKINSNNGPFSYLDVEKSKKVYNKINCDKRVSDKDVYKIVSKRNIIELTGNAGESWIMSPYHCLHFGGRVKQNFRLLLIISYASPFMAVENVNRLSRKSYKKALLRKDSSSNERYLLSIFR